MPMILAGPSPVFPPQFSKDVLVNIYSAYIDNFLNAKDAVRIAKEARPAFMKFLEVGPASVSIDPGHELKQGRMGVNGSNFIARLGIFPPPSWFCCKEGQLG